MKIVIPLLYFFIVAMPGVYIGDTLVNFIDIFIPIFFIYFFRVKIKLNKIQISLLLYFLAIVASIVLASFYVTDIGIEPLLKSLRLFFAILIYPMMLTVHRYFTFDKNIKVVLISGIISSIIAIVLFIMQSQLYRPPQTLFWGGKVMYRAGGVFAEPNTLSLMMSLVFVISLECVLDKRMILMAIFAMVMSLVSIVVSDTRIAFFAVVFVSIISLYRRGLLKIRMLIATVLFFCSLLIAYQVNDVFQRFVDQRVLTTINGLVSSHANVNDISSGRLKIWNDQFDDYITSSLDIIVFGNGYKVGDRVLSDNNYLSALYFCGLFGLITFICYWICNIQLVLNLRRIFRAEFMFRVYSNMIIVYLVFMITCDAMTMSRPLYLLTIYSALACILIKNSKTEKLNKNDVIPKCTRQG